MKLDIYIYSHVERRMPSDQENQESHHNRNSEALKHIKTIVDTDFFYKR